MLLNLQQIEQAHGPRTKEIAVPEWGEDATILVKRLSAQDWIKLKSGDLKGLAAFDYMAQVIRMAAINEDGSPLIDDDHAYLLSENPKLVQRLGFEILEFNNLAGGIKKNSTTSQEESSPTDSA